jgi:hypothetical protein
MNNNNSKSSSSSDNDSCSSGGDPRQSTKRFYFDLTQTHKNYLKSQGLASGEMESGKASEWETPPARGVARSFMGLEVKKEMLSRAEEGKMEEEVVEEVREFEEGKEEEAEEAEEEEEVVEEVREIEEEEEGKEEKEEEVVEVVKEIEEEVEIVEEKKEGDDLRDMLHFVMRSKMGQNMKMDERRKILRSFVATDARLGTYFHASVGNDPRLAEIESFLRQCKKSDSLLTVEVTADHLMVLGDLLEESDLVNNHRRGRNEATPIKLLRKYTAGVRARAVAEVGKTKAGAVKGGICVKKRNFRKNNHNEMGELIQARVLRTEKRTWTNSIDTVHPCPYCGHELVYCMSSAEDHAELVLAANEKWKKMLEDWRIAGSNKKTKPRKPAQPKRMMACMCVVQKCHSIDTGKGCQVCRNFVTNGVKVPFDYNLMKCSCGVCQCKCSAVFRREDWELIYAQVQMNKKEKERKEEKIQKHAKGTGKVLF